MRGFSPLSRRALSAGLLLLVALVAFFLFTGALSGKAQSESLEIARRSLQRAAVECYALEGAYPPDADYLAQHYGVRIDDRRYIVHYEFIASNLMPDITVLPLSGGGAP